MQQVQIGLAGMGNVGAGVYKNLANNRVLLMERVGAELNVKRVVVKDLGKQRDVPLAPGILTDRWEDLLEDPEIQVVVELMGGMHPARELVLGAIERGKIVVTGNKALLAEHGREIFAAAAHHKVPVFFEAAAAGGVPIIKAIREAFIGNHILSMHGIINGTCNYILTRMTRVGSRLRGSARGGAGGGFRGGRPDAGCQWLGRGAQGDHPRVAGLRFLGAARKRSYVEGIEKITATDIRFAAQLGYSHQAARHHQGRRNGARSRCACIRR